MVKAIFSSSPLLLPLALQLGLSQPPPHFTLSQKGRVGKGRVIKASEVARLELQPLNPRPDRRRSTPLSRLSQPPPPIFLGGSLQFCPASATPTPWLFLGAPAQRGLSSGWPRNRMLSVRACRALPVSGRWAPHSTCVISLIPCNGPRPLPLAGRGGHGIMSPHNSLCRPAVWVGGCFLSWEGEDLNSSHQKS